MSWKREDGENMISRRNFLKGLGAALAVAPIVSFATHDIVLDDCDYSSPDDLVAEGEGYSGISIVSPSQGIIYFGDSGKVGLGTTTPQGFIHVKTNGQEIIIK